MKRLNINIYIAIVSLSLFSCTKKEEAVADPTPVNTELADGLPENSKKINCYLYSCIQTYSYSSSSSYYYAFSHAVFSDPTRNLLNQYNHYSNSKIFSSTGGGNIDVGVTTLNNFSLPKNFQSNSEIYYGQNYSNTLSSLNYNAVWQTEGNKTFKPINTIISKGHPIINGSLLNLPNTISRSSSFTININNNIANYDSLILHLEDGSWNVRVRKVVPKNTQSVTFTPQEMSILNSSSSGKLSIYAYNYSNMITNDKVILFELSNQYLLNNIYIN